MTDPYEWFDPPKQHMPRIDTGRQITKGDPYALAALHDECLTVAATPPGARDDAINKAAFNLAQLIGAGALDEDEVVAALWDAAGKTGQPDREISRALRRAGDPSGQTGGIERGKTRPRVIPERPAPSAPPNGNDPLVSPTATQTSEPTDPYEAAVRIEVNRQRLIREARRRLEDEETAKAFREPAWRPTLTLELAVPDEPVTYAVDQIMPTGANVLLTAQYKAGKTTLVNNLTRCLVDCEPFLGTLTTMPPDGRVALFNYEVDARQYRRWLRSSGITHSDQVVVLNLRGYRLPMTSRYLEDWLVRWLLDHDVKVWIVDPFARAFVGSGSENDNAEVGAFLETLDVIKYRAGISELVLPTHTGRAEVEEGSERARGATRLDDWADVRWLLTVDEQETRYFAASGRDVQFPEQALVYDYLSRAPVIAGSGSRGETRKERLENAVIVTVAAHPAGIGAVQLAEAIRQIVRKFDNNALLETRKRLAARGRIRMVEGSAGKPTMHYPPGMDRQ